MYITTKKQEKRFNWNFCEIVTFKLTFTPRKKCREYFRKRWFCLCLMHFLHFSYVIVHNLINNSQRQKREQKKEYSLLKNNFFRFRYYYTMNEHFHSKISECGGLLRNCFQLKLSSLSSFASTIESYSSALGRFQLCDKGLVLQIFVQVRTCVKMMAQCAIVEIVAVHCIIQFAYLVLAVLFQTSLFTLRTWKSQNKRKLICAKHLPF